MRKEITFQEVVPLNNAIAVISGDSEYLAGKLQIEMYNDRGKSGRMVYDKKGVCLIEGLSNQTQYKIEIKRSDMKGMLLYKALTIGATPRESGSKYVVLVGASVGKGWEFDKIPKRLGWKNDIVLGFRARYDFDKSNEINSLANMPIPVSGVIIKECAAYFPRDTSQSQMLIREWVNSLLSNHVTPILATVIPVTEAHNKSHAGRFNSLLAYNDFIRDYAYRSNILLFDLEKVLRTSDQDRHLREQYAQSDGLHLVTAAYAELDKAAASLFRSFN